MRFSALSEEGSSCSVQILRAGKSTRKACLCDLTRGPGGECATQWAHAGSENTLTQCTWSCKDWQPKHGRFRKLCPGWANTLSQHLQRRAARVSGPIQPWHIRGGNLFLSLKLDAQKSLDFAVSINVEVVKLLFFFFLSKSVSSLACVNRQKQSKKKVQFSIKPCASADLPCSVPKRCLPNAPCVCLRYHRPCPWAPCPWANRYLLSCCPGGIGGGHSLACFGKLFEKLRVSIPMYELLSLHYLLQAGFVTINKTSRTRILVMPVFVTTRLPWGRAHGWIYQCKLCRRESTFVM